MWYWISPIESSRIECELPIHFDDATFGCNSTTPTFEHLVTNLTPDTITLRTLNAKLGALAIRKEINIRTGHAGEEAWAGNVVLKRQLAGIEEV